MFPNPPGRNNSGNVLASLDKAKQDYRFVAQMDEDYLVIGGHIDETMQGKIIRGEYIDFGKLLPRDKIIVEEDGKMELVIKNGRTFWVPVSETTVINSFSKWEQAFRIYSNVFTRTYPGKSSELIQYNHIIHSIAMQYIWDNVYSYDKEFRIHMAKHHPNHSWAVILQQAWSMKLRDRLPPRGESNYHHHSGSQNQMHGH